MSNDKSPKQRTVLITGAAGGLGSALVTVFAKHGWLVAAGSHSQPVAEDSGASLSMPLDVTDRGSVEGGVKRCLEQFGHLDVLINNAGMIADDVLPTLDPAAWDRCVAVCLRGPFLCTQAVLRPMCARRSGHIINIGSYSGLTGTPGQAAYSAAKAGLIGFTQSVAKEYGSRNIQANVILPGAMNTPLVAALSPERHAAYTKANCLGRWSDPLEVAEFLVALTRLGSASGQIFQLDSRIAPWS
ncbi:MAG TPA: SDR family NAD(P)-dependent oxidoreductase [Candidatus Limnocylindria bacterium]|jgi:3-oxoacyl-[acyl-carrier protein] reductase|nr:SDR family NAD(P)-dependent oxidoreductase [Candidatus Limnocylindria bacterium]